MTAARLTTAELLAAIAEVQARRHVHGDQDEPCDGHDPEYLTGDESDRRAGDEENRTERGWEWFQE